VAATPPNPALPETEPRQPTALSAVFRRIANEPPARPAPALSSGPQLLGFAEPVEHVPPVEDFLARHEEAATTVVAESVETIVLEPVAPEPEPEPELGPELPAPEPELPPPEPELSPAPIRARARELPLVSPTPAAPASNRPQNLIGRLGRRPGDAAPAPAPPTPPPAPTMPAPAARRPTEPAQKLAAPSPPPAPPDRTGRPSLPRNRRLYRRAKLPAEIEIGGVPCTLIDVSIGGFAATGVPQVEPNALVPVTIRLTIDGIEVGTLLDARIIYVTQGRSSGRFVDLNPSQMAFLRYIVTWRGESVGAVGTTTLLDAIAGGAERGFGSGAAGRSDTEPKSRWWAGLIGRKITPPR